MTDNNYIQIQGWMVSKLNLSGNELLAYALIYGFSQDGESEFKGSIKYVCDWLNVSRPTASKALASLVDKKLVEKKVKIESGVTFNRYKISLSPVKNLYGGSKESLQGGSKESLQGGSKESLHHNTIINNTIIDNNKENNRERFSKQKFVFIDELESIEIEEEKIEELKAHYSEKFDWCVGKLSGWLVTKNKKSKGIKSFKAYLSNWVLDAYNTANIQNKVSSVNSKPLSQQSNGFARSSNYNAEKVREFEKYGFVFPISVTYNLDPQDFASCKGNPEKYLDLKYDYLKKAIEGSGYNWHDYELKLKEKSKNYLVDGKF